MEKILVLANHYNTLRIFRRELLKELVSRGHSLLVIIPECDEENKQILESYGCKVQFVKMERRGMNPLKDIGLFLKYLKIIKEYRPNRVITYTIKCNIYGAMACKFKKVPCYVNVTGLGSAFQGQGKTRKLVSLMYKLSLNKAKRIFFENEGNRNTLVEEGIVKKEQTVVMNGAGVNLDEFSLVDYPQEKETIRFLFVGRVMQEKGVDELFEAIVQLRKEYPNTEFDFIGWYEDDYKSKVEGLQEQGYINFHGFQADVKPFFERAHCVILPSWHEGMSNTLLEGAAMGRPLITSDIHGCKEAVIDKKTGYLAKVKNTDDLLDKMQKFMGSSYEEKRQMGLNGRIHMEKNFDKRDVVNKTMKEIFVRL